ncbi:Cu-processing system ATP-binding protein [Algoriphagus boseongensis]|uniref:Cu-processing system ATP-binding protein n=1 Tax=Algoriphagus boseongensis TaxID=1442587 RepID=A0A4V3D229_9BACT|nr:ABC transporter ATP-binding protein [Algoriphagus boseongensis]TDQ16563.1 Cu-processing system ATP-binding protein [Algoriphagus boseongensis]
MISVNSISKKFGKQQVLHDFELRFEAGHSYAVMGPNGSGKTTLIKSILGMVLPDSGEILVDGQSIQGHTAYRQQIGYMPQIGRYPSNMKIGQLFSMMKDMRPEVKEYDLDLVNQFELEMIKDKAMGTLSGGTRQKVSAALAFLFQPKVLILDEPTAGLDPIAVEILKAKIQKERKEGKLILITSHILNDLEELTDQAIYLFEGEVFFNDSIESLKEITGEGRFSPAIAKLMQWTLKKKTSTKSLTHA